MAAHAKAFGTGGESPRFFDSFTRWMLGIMFAIELAIFASGTYMAHHKLTGTGTDDIVNNLASATAHGEHHPFVELPGDAELSAFSIGNFFAGLIVGYHWVKLFGSKPEPDPKKED